MLIRDFLRAVAALIRKKKLEGQIFWLTEDDAMELDLMAFFFESGDQIHVGGAVWSGVKPVEFGMLWLALSRASTKWIGDECAEVDCNGHGENLATEEAVNTAARFAELSVLVAKPVLAEVERVASMPRQITPIDSTPHNGQIEAACALANYIVEQTELINQAVKDKAPGQRTIDRYRYAEEVLRKKIARKK